mgnify:CR=1 FL=1
MQICKLMMSPIRHRDSYLYAERDRNGCMQSDWSDKAVMHLCVYSTNYKFLRLSDYDILKKSLMKTKV